MDRRESDLEWESNPPTTTTKVISRSMALEETSFFVFFLTSPMDELSFFRNFVFKNTCKNIAIFLGNCWVVKFVDRKSNPSSWQFPAYWQFRWGYHLIAYGCPEVAECLGAYSYGDPRWQTSQVGTRAPYRACKEVVWHEICSRFSRNSFFRSFGRGKIFGFDSRAIRCFFIPS